MTGLHLVRVTRRRQLAPEVVGLTLEGVHDALPSWTPGAHVDVVLPSGLVRQYSLCGPLGGQQYEIAVLREQDGRGGSEEVHRSLGVGAELKISDPRNRFPLERAAEYVFVAGGIGITPILPMIEAIDGLGINWRLVYGGRSRATMAFLEELELWSENVTVVPQDEHGLIDLETELHGHETAAIYTCGPTPMIEAVQGVVERWDGGNLHFERFVAAPARTPEADDAPAEAFEVQLGIDGPVLSVPEDKSILQVVLDAGADVLFSCEEGTCGSCETTVLAGDVDHRDELLTDQERADGQMLICVSRASCPRLVLDIAGP